MGEQGFRVDPAALKAYSRVLEDQAQQIASIRSVLGSVTLASDDFGKLPNSGELYAAYQEHADADQENFTDLIEILQATAEGLEHSAAAYEDQDHVVAAVYGGGR
ncbi:WXG100 family type VII secretion target [Kitasatospora camelliae]|uniref:Type VII secretion target n=1 Tax=Kitasatospora camelliae TaxID=3156397 RepID=A0AAU8JYX8_9ACTN